MRTTLLVLATASFALSTPRTADACGAVPCWAGSFVPETVRSEVPANIPAVYWRPMRSYEDLGDPKNVELVNAAAPDTPLAFTVQPVAGGDFLLVPSAPLVAGQRYTISDRNECEVTHELGPEATFMVGPTAPPFTELGTLVVSSASIEQMGLGTGWGPCAADATVAQISIKLEPAPSAIPWMETLHFETLVDGKAWSYQTIITVNPPPGRSELGRGRDLVYEVCKTDDPNLSGLSAGKHTITMRARLPGSTQVATSSPLEVKLDCKGMAEPGTEPSPAGCNAAGAGAAPALALALLALRRRRR